MTVSAERARLNLERCIPELKELARKKLFTKAEVSAVTQKRSNFEHILAGRGTSTPLDYAKYAIYEINLDRLRKIRARRRGVKVVNYAGSRRIFEILDRGNKKFPADLDLWMQHIGFARTEKAWKRLEALITKALRLHPTKADIWIYAGRQAFDEEADLTKARSYMQRGLRFCRDRKELWIEFIRIEMAYLAKLEGRRQVLGIEDNLDHGSDRDPGALANGSETTPGDKLGQSALHVANHPRPPSDRTAVVRVLIDAAIKQFSDEEREQLLEDLYDLCASFTGLSIAKDTLSYVAKTASALLPQSPSAWFVACKMPFFQVDFQSVEIVEAVQTFLSQLTGALSKLPATAQPHFVKKLDPFIESLSNNEELDPDIRTVLLMKQQQLQQITSISPSSQFG